MGFFLALSMIKDIFFLFQYILKGQAHLRYPFFFFFIRLIYSLLFFILFFSLFFCLFSQFLSCFQFSFRNPFFSFLIKIFFFAINFSHFWFFLLGVSLLELFCLVCHNRVFKDLYIILYKINLNL
jgi:hypothetical protein